MQNMLRIALLSFFIIGTSAPTVFGATSDTTYDSGDLSTLPVSQKKKVIKIDDVNVVYRDMGTGCPTGYLPIGVRGMPKNSSYYSTISVPRTKYVTRFKLWGSTCSTVAWEYYIYSSYTPKWVKSFMTPELICAPFSSEWNT